MVKNRNSIRGRSQRNDERGEILHLKVDGQEYAHVLRILVDDFVCEAICTDGTKRLCYMHGRMYKKRRIAAGDIILVGLRNYQPAECAENIAHNDNAADVILKYMPNNLRLMKALGELPDIIKLSEEGTAQDDGYFELEDGDIDQGCL